MTTYRNAYRVHNTLITYGIWERHQIQGWKNLFGVGTPPAIFNAYAGVTDVYYHNVFSTFAKVMEREMKRDARIFDQMMDRYEAQLEDIQSVIARGEPLDDEAFAVFVQKFQDAWIGLDLSYMPDYLAMDAMAERRSALVREKAFGFYIGADQILRKTMERLFPKIHDFVDYVALPEVLSGKMPSPETLKRRSEHYIYYKEKVITGETFEAFCRRESIRIESAYAPLRKEIRGQSAAEGRARGIAFFATDNDGGEPPKAGYVLIARDLSERHFALLEEASAIVLDSGTYYGQAAIVARSLKKPCIIGTKIASMVLSSEDVLVVDGNNGTVHIATG